MIFIVSNGKELKKNGGRLAMVVGHNAAVIKTVKATCGDAVFSLFEKREQAVAALQP